MYVKYCENKPKSEYIVAEYIDYFEVHSHFTEAELKSLSYSCICTANVTQ